MRTDRVSAVLRQHLSDGKMDSYALLICHGGQKAVLTSPNVDENTCFEVASLTKVTVTAPLVMMAIAEGKLALTDRLGDFFPGLTDMRAVTVLRQQSQRARLR